MSVIVKLNVGGQLFTTTLATLQKYPDSMLGAMFNGSFNNSGNDDGCHFITHLQLFNQSQTRILLVIMLFVIDSHNSVVIQICTILTVAVDTKYEATKLPPIELSISNVAFIMIFFNP